MREMQQFWKRLKPSLLFLMGVFMGVVGVRIWQNVQDIALLTAACHCDRRATARLLNSGANPNRRFDVGLIAGLMESGDSATKAEYFYAFVEEATGNEWHHVNKMTPLLAVTLRPGYADVVLLLLKYGANPNIPDRAGETPLMGAVSFTGDFATIDALIAAGANVNARWKDGGTVLEMARTATIKQRLEKAGAGYGD